MKFYDLFTTELRRLVKTGSRNSMPRKAAAPVPGQDLLRQLHEMEIRQINLELQNKELLQVRAELESAFSRLSDLFDFAPVGYLTLARDGSIRQINLAGAVLLGSEPARLVMRRFDLLVSDQSRPAFQAILEKLLTGRGRETCELALPENGNELFWVRLEATCFEGGQESRAVLVDISERKQAEEELKFMSIHDALTSLYNYGFFAEAMARLERGRQFPVSIIMADLDHLKLINDQQGHAAGDALLKRVAQVLTAAFRAEDVIARVGGDEFAVLLPNTEAAAAEVALKRVRQMVRENNIAHTGPALHLSLGVSTAEKSKHLSIVLQEADASMYREKRRHHVV